MCKKCGDLVKTNKKIICNKCYRKNYFKLHQNEYEEYKRKRREYYHQNKILKPKLPKKRYCVSCNKYLDHYCRGMCSKCYKKWYRKTKPEVHRNANKKCYEKNKERRLKTQKDRYEKNKQKYNKQSAEWYSKNKEKVFRKQKEYYKNHLEKRYEISNRKYQKKVIKINKLRKKFGLPLVNEKSKWISEKMLYELIKFYCPHLTIKNNKKFHWLGNRKHLDIFIEELKIAIEYDGMQHYKYIDYFFRGDYNKFKKQIYNDKLKEKLCKENNIKLLRWKENKRITEFNVLKFLKENNIQVKTQTYLKIK